MQWFGINPMDVKEKNRILFKRVILPFVITMLFVILMVITNLIPLKITGIIAFLAPIIIFIYGPISGKLLRKSTPGYIGHWWIFIFGILGVLMLIFMAAILLKVYLASNSG